MTQIKNIEIEFTKNGNLIITLGTNVIKVEAEDVDTFIDSLIDEAWQPLK